MFDIEITGLTRQAKPKPNKADYTVLAFFDCELDGLALHGCAFVRTPRQGLTVWPPKLESSQDTRRAVCIIDDRLRNAMTRKVQETYRVMGGTDGEYIPSEEVQEKRQVRLKPTIHQPIAHEDSGLQRFLGNGAE